MGKKIRHGIKGGDGSDLVPPNMKPVYLSQQIEHAAKKVSGVGSPQFGKSGRNSKAEGDDTNVSFDYDKNIDIPQIQTRNRFTEVTI
jgi:hypothetical protein